MQDDNKCDDVKIWVTSFNMGAKALEFEDPKETRDVHRKVAESVPPGYDVYVCGAQELVDKRYTSIIEKTLKARGYRRTSLTKREWQGEGTDVFGARNAPHWPYLSQTDIRIR